MCVFLLSSGGFCTLGIYYDRGDYDDALYDVLPVGRDAHHREADGQHAYYEHAEDHAPELALAARHARSAEDDGGDDVHLGAVARRG